MVSLFWKVLNVLSLVTVLTVNFLATSLPINNVTTAEISDRYPVLFTPAGYVFSIWGLIYLLLIGFAIYQALPGQAGNPLLKRVGALFFFANLFNSLWIFAWHYERLSLSLLIMLALLITLVVLYIRLHSTAVKSSAAEAWLVKIPFSVYLGWISVATIANVSVVLYSLNWSGLGFAASVWTVVMIAVAARLRRDAAFVLVLVWALVGIGIKQAEITAVQGTAWAAAAIFFLSMILFIFLKKKKLSVRA